jgi:hypothetical protein
MCKLLHIGHLVFFLLMAQERHRCNTEQGKGEQTR